MTTQIQRPRNISYNLVWSVIDLDWVEMTQPGTVAGGGTGDASAANQLLGNISLASIDTKLTSQATAAKQDTQTTALGTLLTTSDFDTKVGSLTEAAPGSDTASSGLNGRLQRIAQRLSTIVTALGSPFQAGGSIGNTTFASTIADGASVTLGAKADAKNAATDTTAITAMSVWKQISASVQSIVSLIPTALSNGFFQVSLKESVSVGVTGPLTDTQLRATPVPVSGTVTASGPLTDTQLRATPVPVSGTVTASGPLTDTQLRATAVPISGTVTASGPVTDTQLRASAVSTKELRAATTAQTSVADNASNVTLLAANAARLGATIANDSSAALYLKLGATASLTSYAARIVQYGYYEVPFNYTGIIDGIWATDPNDGAARIEEITA